MWKILFLDSPAAGIHEFAYFDGGPVALFPTRKAAEQAALAEQANGAFEHYRLERHPEVHPQRKGNDEWTRQILEAVEVE